MYTCSLIFFLYNLSGAKRAKAYLYDVNQAYRNDCVVLALYRPILLCKEYDKTYFSFCHLKESGMLA